MNTDFCPATRHHRGLRKPASGRRRRTTSNLAACTLALAVSVGALWGCSTSTPPGPEGTELVAKNEKKRVDGTQEKLFAEGKELYASELYSAAREVFESLAASYPGGPYTEFAELKVADADFAVGDYINAAVQYQSFIANHPTSQQLPYSLLRSGESLLLSCRGVGKETTPASKALELYDRLLREFPSSPYARMAIVSREQALALIAAHEEYVANFYLNTERPEAAAARRKVFEERWKPLLDEAQAARKRAEQEEQPTVLSPTSKGPP